MNDPHKFVESLERDFNIKAERKDRGYTYNDSCECEYRIYFESLKKWYYKIHVMSCNKWEAYWVYETFQLYSVFIADIEYILQQPISNKDRTAIVFGINRFISLRDGAPFTFSKTITVDNCEKLNLPKN